ncbi:unnamed protein product [Ambrosiozyma monospora]|uniref:6-phosphogluconolactonase-like protein n=1 Tax=Ambrosiozyma monospora TaxID=43982 RepID=A0A9W6YLY7_AMBMO|nr:unnamed protein product [Ambrosiozyma monospora]
MVKTYSYADSQDVAEALARYIIQIQNKTLNHSDKFKIAISGGSLGKVLQKGLIQSPELAKQVKWHQWEVYFSDERLVKLDHPDSNYGLFNQLVLQALPSSAPRPNVVTIKEALVNETGSTDEEIAKDYEQRLPRDGLEVVGLDLVLLGCGPDGHTCSLFPGHDLLKENEKLIVYIADSPKPPPRRITFTFPYLKKSKNIAFVAEGAGKAPVLKQIFGEEKSGLPCELVNELGVPVSWFVNDAAIDDVDVIASKF